MLQAKVLRVIDGDTIEVNSTFRVRMDFIDAPETRKNSPEREAGLKTKEWLRERVEGQVIDLDIKKVDMYNRFLSVCYQDGVNINGEMVKLKLAEIYAPKLHDDGKMDV